MTTELIKELYFRELDGRHQQDSRTTVQIGVLTVLGGVLVFCFQHARPDNGSSLQFYVFIVSLLFAVLFYALSLIWVLRANVGYLYERLPLSDVLYNYYEALKKYYTETPNVRDSAEQDFEAFLRQRMVEATTRNAETNLSRSARHYFANCLLAVAVIFSLLASAPVLVSLNRTNRNTIHVEKVQVKELHVPPWKGE